MSTRATLALAALVLWTGIPVAAQQSTAAQFPATLKLALDYTHSKVEDIGTPNTPLCREGKWTATLRLNLERKSASAGLVTYGVKAGNWTADGHCTGTMQFEMGDQLCRWSTSGRSSGSGSFPSDVSQGELAIYPGARTFVFSFMLNAPGGYSYGWEPYCERPGGKGTADEFYIGSVTGRVVLQNGGPKFTATSDTTWANDNINGRYHGHAVARFYERLRAVPGGPYAVARGETVELDGSGSEGVIDEYEWAIKPGPECPTGTRPQLTLKGAKVSFKALCALTLTLTVKSGQEQDSKQAGVAVKPRDWKTPFEHVAAEGPLEAPAPLMRQLRDSTGSVFWGVELVGGENVSADEPTAGGVELLYPFSAGNSWEGRGYAVMQVRDDGPFDGLWYVGEYRLKVSRKTLVNKYLTPGGTPVMSQSLYAENKRLGTDIDAYLAAIRSHEGKQDAKGTLGHSGLLERALRADDPARKLEALAENSREALIRAADDHLHRANVKFCNEVKDPLPIIWQGRVAFPKDDGSAWMEGPARVGGAEGYSKMQGCG